jgi:hypothetical protein
MKKKLSYPMLLVLANLHNGNPAAHHCRNRSDYGGLCKTVFALRKRGLITDSNGKYTLTAAGLEALKKGVKNVG